MNQRTKHCVMQMFRAPEKTNVNILAGNVTCNDTGDQDLVLVR